MNRTTLIAFLPALAIALGAGAARASADYPAAIRDKALLTYVPACTLCHAEKDGSDASLATDFAHTLWALGMRGKDVVSLEISLDKVRARRWDTDGDGVSDVDELLGSTDPSGPALSNYPAAEHGCSIAYTQRDRASTVFGAAMVIGAFVASLARRRRDTRPPSQFRRP